MNEIKIFSNHQFGEVRTAINESGDPLFCLNDLCLNIGINNSRAVKSRLDEGDVSQIDTPTSSGIQSMTFVNESGMYDVIIRSDSENAKPFRKWVTSEVLPAIRKTGGYIVTTTEDTPETILARAVLVAQESINRLKSQVEIKEQQIALQAKELKAQAPKAEYYDEVLDSEGLISSTIIAKDLGMSASSLNKRLHQMGIIYRQSDTWVPFSKYQDKGFCKSKTFPYTDKDGKQKTAIHFYWTEKGREFIMQKIGSTSKVAVL